MQHNTLLQMSGLKTKTADLIGWLRERESAFNHTHTLLSSQSRAQSIDFAAHFFLPNLFGEAQLEASVVPTSLPKSIQLNWLWVMRSAVGAARVTH